MPPLLIVGGIALAAIVGAALAGRAGANPLSSAMNAAMEQAKGGGARGNANSGGGTVGTFLGFPFSPSGYTPPPDPIVITPPPATTAPPAPPGMTAPPAPSSPPGGGFVAGPPPDREPKDPPWAPPAPGPDYIPFDPYIPPAFAS